MKTLFTAFLATVFLTGAASAQTLDRIKSTGVLKLGYRIDAQPLSYQDADGNPAGYSPLVCATLAQGILDTLQIGNLDVEFVEVDAADRFEKVVSGEIDLLCGAASITLGRRGDVDFSIPTFVDGTSILLPVDAPEGLSDLIGKKLGVRRDTTTETTLNTSLAASEVEAEVVRFADHTAAMAAIENGEIDAYFADQTILAGLWLASPEQGKLKLANELLTLEKHGLVMARGDTEFRLMVDRLLSQMFYRGDMQRTFQQIMPGVQPGDALQALFALSPIQE